MLSVFMLFMIPVGGGIPAGALLARQRGIGWPAMSLLYFVSDVVLAFLFEPILLGLVAVGRKVPALARGVSAMREATARNAALYGGAGSGPVALILIAFGIDPMTGRAAAHAAGHGFVSGWAIAIAGDMLYFWVLAAATLKLNALIGDPTLAVTAVLALMILVPALIKRLRK
ncbi:MAG TPA: hypothetical protein VNI01_12480 [Elusimicrobiota bacterium]|jgi:hypothetical protein|nr:hypothetical protein [Elusimicrobiota bacterium]